MGFGVCVFILRESVCVRGSAHKSNVVQEAGQCVCVCPHTNQAQTQVRVSAFIPFQACCPVFLSHSLFLLLKRNNTTTGKCKKKEGEEGGVAGLRCSGLVAVVGGYKALGVGIGFW